MIILLFMDNVLKDIDILYEWVLDTLIEECERLKEVGFIITDNVLLTSKLLDIFVDVKLYVVYNRRLYTCDVEKMAENTVSVEDLFIRENLRKCCKKVRRNE